MKEGSTRNFIFVGHKMARPILWLYYSIDGSSPLIFSTRYYLGYILDSKVFFTLDKYTCFSMVISRNCR